MKAFALLLIGFFMVFASAPASGSEKRPKLLKGVSINQAKVFITAAQKSKPKPKIVLRIQVNNQKSVFFLAKNLKCKNKNCLYQVSLKHKALKKKQAAKKIKRNKPFQIFITRKESSGYTDYQRYLCQKNRRCLLEKNLGDGGTLTISNWPFYVGGNVFGPFEKKTDINIIYKEEINSNEEFFNLIEPIFSNNSSGGRDIIVVSDWLAAYFNQRQFVQDFDKSKLPVVYKNLMPELKMAPFDLERSYSLPWQSNMTGLLVRKDLAPSIKSVNDLFDNKYKGRVAFSDAIYETVPLIMKADGVDPVTATESDWLNTIEKIKQAKESGQILGFSSSLHVPALIYGDIVASIGRASDGFVVSLDRSPIKYVQPTEGCLLWSDSILIPAQARNIDNAHKFINYFYSLSNQAQMTRYTNFVSPVPAVKEKLLKTNPSLAKSQLIFPTSSFLNKCSPVQPELPNTQLSIVEAWRDAISEPKNRIFP